MYIRMQVDVALVHMALDQHLVLLRIPPRQHQKIFRADKVDEFLKPVLLAHLLDGALHLHILQICPGMIPTSANPKFDWEIRGHRMPRSKATTQSAINMAIRFLVRGHSYLMGEASTRARCKRQLRCAECGALVHPCM